MNKNIMLYKSIFSFIVFFYVSFCYAQNTVGTTFVTPDVSDGYTLINVNTDVFLINNCGEVVNEWNSIYLPGNAVYLLPNGNLLRAGRVNTGSTITMGGAGGIVELFNWDGNLLWSFLYNDDDKRQHHDVYPMPNGNVLILAVTVMSEQEALDAGRDPALLIDNRLYNEQIVEVEPVGSNGGNIVWEWNIKDHLVQDFDSTKSNFGIVSDSPGKLDINFLNGGSGEDNWLHFNSIQFDEIRDQIVISARNMSEIYIIDHSTTTAEASGSSGGNSGKGGDFLYRWGNPQAYGQGTSTDQQLFGQHYPHFIGSGLTDEGKIIVFNNGLNRDPDFSEVFIIDPPINADFTYNKVNGVAFGPTQPFYSYSNLSQTPSTFYSPIVSSAQRLENGNILICEGLNGEVFEIDSNDQVVWEYRNPVDNSNGNRVNQGDDPPTSSLIFRAIKYPLDYPAFDNVSLNPGPPLEGNPNLTNCNNVLSTERFAAEDIQLFPNPTNGRVNISFDGSISKTEVYTMQGRLVLTQNKTRSLNLSSLSKGVYLVKVHSENNFITKKIIKN